MNAASFLAQYVNDNIGPLGAIGRFPLGAFGYAAGIPGIAPGGRIESPAANPGLFGGLTGLGLQSLLG